MKNCLLAALRQQQESAVTTAASSAQRSKRSCEEHTLWKQTDQKDQLDESERIWAQIHSHVDQEFPQGSELLTLKLKTLKKQTDVEAQFFTRFAKQSQTVMLASYYVAWHIAHVKKPYSEGESIKTCLTDVISILSPENENLLKKMAVLQL